MIVFFVKILDRGSMCFSKMSAGAAGRGFGIEDGWGTTRSMKNKTTKKKTMKKNTKIQINMKHINMKHRFWRIYQSIVSHERQLL